MDGWMDERIYMCFLLNTKYMFCLPLTSILCINIYIYIYDPVNYSFKILYLESHFNHNENSFFFQQYLPPKVKKTYSFIESV